MMCMTAAVLLRALSMGTEVLGIGRRFFVAGSLHDCTLDPWEQGAHHNVYMACMAWLAGMSMIASLALQQRHLAMLCRTSYAFMRLDTLIDGAVR